MQKIQELMKTRLSDSVRRGSTYISKTSNRMLDISSFDEFITKTETISKPKLFKKIIIQITFIDESDVRQKVRNNEKPSYISNVNWDRLLTLAESGNASEKKEVKKIIDQITEKENIRRDKIFKNFYSLRKHMQTSIQENGSNPIYIGSLFTTMKIGADYVRVPFIFQQAEINVDVSNKKMVTITISDDLLPNMPMIVKIANKNNTSLSSMFKQQPKNSSESLNWIVECYKEINISIDRDEILKTIKTNLEKLKPKTKSELTTEDKNQIAKQTTFENICFLKL